MSENQQTIFSIAVIAGLIYFFANIDFRKTDKAIEALTGKTVYHSVSTRECYDLSSCMDYERKNREAWEK